MHQSKKHNSLEQNIFTASILQTILEDLFNYEHTLYFQFLNFDQNYNNIHYKFDYEFNTNNSV